MDEPNFRFSFISIFGFTFHLLLSASPASLNVEMPSAGICNVHARASRTHDKDTSSRFNGPAILRQR
jgi:hypothetical protein